MHGYIAVVLRRPDTGYRTEFPDLPGCRCSGRSVEDALARAERTLATYVAALRRQNLPLPLPRPTADMITESNRLGAVAAACLRAPNLTGNTVTNGESAAQSAPVLPLRSPMYDLQRDALARI